MDELNKVLKPRIILLINCRNNYEKDSNESKVCFFY